jgi:two-component system NtrC family response regulator
LLESELFGYERGAFTGANARRRGKIEFAHGGTFFLDEIGDLPLPLQGKLLRFLQERVVERIGGRQELPVDVRIVCATHQDLRQLIQARRFREDLFYRISELSISIPPLRARPGDAALLAHAFLDKYAGQRQHAIRGFTPEALATIEQSPYPGNVRELENCIKRAVIMAEGACITVADLGLPPLPFDEPQPINLRQVRENAERQALVKALGRTNGNIAKAAGILGISRPTLYDLINRFGLRTI